MIYRSDYMGYTNPKFGCYIEDYMGCPNPKFGC